MMENHSVAAVVAIEMQNTSRPALHDVFPPLLLALLTLLGRLLCTGPVYVRAILSGTYIIQPPGYWLFNRIAGLFRAPAVTITAMNILFSVAGVVMLYLTALLFTRRWNAILAAFAYSSIFYIWFSGEVHSTYASQVCFPVAVFYMLVRFKREGKNWLLYLSAPVYAVGAGLRPSDGVFLIPMVLYFTVTCLPWKTAARYLALISLLCLGWVIPTAHAFHEAQSGASGAVHYVGSILQVRSILAGINKGSIANVLRYVFPLLIAFGPVLTAMYSSLVHEGKEWSTRMLLLWIVPGSLFLTLFYISDAPYLNFLTAALVLLALKAPRRLLLTAAFNTAVFLGFWLIPSHRLAVNVWNCDIGKYTHYAVSHQWQPNLSDVQSSVSSSEHRE